MLPSHLTLFLSSRMAVFLYSRSLYFTPATARFTWLLLPRVLGCLVWMAVVLWEAWDVWVALCSFVWVAASLMTAKECS